MHKIKPLLFLSLLVPLSCYATNLVDFQSIELAMHAGKPITAYVDFSKCTRPMPVNAYLTVKNALILNSPNKGKSIAFSDSHLTVNEPGFPHQAIREQITYHLNQQGSLTIDSVLLNPASYKIINQKPMHSSCQLNDGVLFHTT
ncbi:MAG: VirK family protein [Coxiellaceae bacterium]|nr:VirK family protein [Coxiellaceae bacterium]